MKVYFSQSAQQYVASDLGTIVYQGDSLNEAMAAAGISSEDESGLYSPVDPDDDCGDFADLFND